MRSRSQLHRLIRDDDLRKCPNVSFRKLQAILCYEKQFPLHVIRLPIYMPPSVKRSINPLPEDKF